MTHLAPGHTYVCPLLSAYSGRRLGAFLNLSGSAWWDMPDTSAYLRSEAMDRKPWNPLNDHRNCRVSGQPFAATGRPQGCGNGGRFESGTRTFEFVRGGRGGRWRVMFGTCTLPRPAKIRAGQ